MRPGTASGESSREESGFRAIVFTFDHGLEIRLDCFNNPDHALEAAALRE
jgi:hypothetical protein